MEGDLQVFYRGAKRLYTHQKGPLFESMSITVFFFFCGGFRNSEHAVCLIQLPNYKIRTRKKNVDFFSLIYIIIIHGVDDVYWGIKEECGHCEVCVFVFLIIIFILSIKICKLKKLLMILLFLFHIILLMHIASCKHFLFML